MSNTKDVKNTLGLLFRYLFNFYFYLHKPKLIAYFPGALLCWKKHLPPHTLSDVSFPNYRKN